MFSRLEHGWRIVGSAIGFSIFGLGGLAVSLTVFPFIALLIWEPRKRQAAARWVIMILFRAFARLLWAMRTLDLEYRHVERLKKCSGTMVIANHPTLIDIILIISVLPNAQCIVKHQLFRNPFLGLVVRAAGYIRNDDDPEKLMEDCVESLKKGENLVIFPEGTRTRFNRDNRFQRGFANVALRAGADVQRISIQCEPMMLAKNMGWHDLPETRPKYTLIVGEQLDVAPYLEYRSMAIGARRLTTFLEEFYAENLLYARF
jgi:1-acyl-sn-glycerol-3-phosphate acyltransferase